MREKRHRRALGELEEGSPWVFRNPLCLLFPHLSFPMEPLELAETSLRKTLLRTPCKIKDICFRCKD